MSQARAEQGDADVSPRFSHLEYVECDFDFFCLSRVPRRARALGSASHLLQNFYPCTRISVRVLPRQLWRAGARAQVCFMETDMAVSRPLGATMMWWSVRNDTVFVMPRC